MFFQGFARKIRLRLLGIDCCLRVNAGRRKELPLCVKPTRCLVGKLRDYEWIWGIDDSVAEAACFIKTCETFQRKFIDTDGPANPRRQVYLQER